MKRLRIWLNSLTLIQQFMLISFLTVFFFSIFVFSILNESIDQFTNTQMHSYIHRSQEEYFAANKNGVHFDDTNVYHYVFDLKRNVYLEKINDATRQVLLEINPHIYEECFDGTIEIEDLNETVYSITPYDNGRFALVSIVRDEYRSEFRSALINGVVNTCVMVLGVLFVFLMMWVFTIIRPLNQIRSYITKVKNSERAELNIRRNDEIGEVAEELVSMNEELANQQRIREEMIQNISHDLKTPIATIKSYSESINDGIYPYDTLEKSVNVIYEHADRLEKKVYSLITYNKMGYLEDTVEGDNLEMNDVVEKAILSCRVLRNDISIEKDAESEVYFHGEEEPWRTVVENLIDNSLRYAKARIVIKLRKNLLEVYNDGELMSKDRLEKLFKPYEKGTKGNFGLGLSIIKKVCDTYGYTVTGENRDDGVVFRITRINTITKVTNI